MTLFTKEQLELIEDATEKLIETAHLKQPPPVVAEVEVAAAAGSHEESV